MAELHLLSPRGFRAGAVYAGIKSRNTPDVGLLVADADASAAAVFTANQVVSPAVKVGRAHVAGGVLRAVVVNAGNANACTGRQGERDAKRMCAVAAGVAGTKAGLVLPSSTGIIGHLLPMDKVERGIVEAGQYLGSSLEHAQLFADAILTTDTRRKAAAVSFKLGRERVILAGVTKGSGMIGPRLALPGANGGILATGGTRSSARRGSALDRGSASGRGAGATSAKGKRVPKHATMLAYLTTDAAVPPPF